jgi:osmoprotectant transport system permease protein
MGFLEYLTSPGTLEALQEQATAHVAMVVTAMIGGVLIGVALGVTAFKVPRVRTVVLTVTSVLLTIPSLALFALLLPLTGIGFWAPTVGLMLYSLLPIARNTLSGLSSIDPAIAESARGMGMGTWKRLWKIELPNAWPVILTGLRVATQLAVGIAAVAVIVGGPGLGVEIYQRGIRRIGSPGAFEALLTGTLAIIVVAVAFDLLYTALGRLTVSKGIR